MSWFFKKLTVVLIFLMKLALALDLESYNYGSDASFLSRDKIWAGGGGGGGGAWIAGVMKHYR